MYFEFKKRKKRKKRKAHKKVKPTNLLDENDKFACLF